MFNRVILHGRSEAGRIGEVICLLEECKSILQRLPIFLDVSIINALAAK